MIFDSTNVAMLLNSGTCPETIIIETSILNQNSESYFLPCVIFVYGSVILI